MESLANELSFKYPASDVHQARRNMKTVISIIKALGRLGVEETLRTERQ
jgi:hypothetical protein